MLAPLAEGAATVMAMKSNGVRREGGAASRRNPMCEGPLGPSVDAPGAAGDQLGTVDEMARFEGLFDGGLVGLAGGDDGKPLGGEGVFVGDLSVSRLACCWR